MRVRLKTERLQALLAASPLSQNHWALKLGISRGHWSDIVNGRHPYPTARTRQRMLEVFAVDTDALFEVDQSAVVDTAQTDFAAALPDRYIIDRELAQGWMGTVFLARDVVHGRVVAVKTLAPEAVCGIGVHAFMREISVIARLQHPHILPLYDSGVAAEQPFFVMPWIRDGSLRDRLQRKTRLDVDETSRILDGVSQALDYAHHERVLHCDIKPANILLYGNHAYLMDFGISRVLHAEASEWRARRGIDSSAGTPAYVSPEQASGEELDARTDVYSLGCVAYEMLTGRTPFEGTNTESVVARRFLVPPPDIREYAPDVPAEIESVVHRAMTVEKPRRTSCAGALASQFAAATQQRSSLARVTTAISVASSRVLGALRTRAGRPAFHRFGGSMYRIAQDFRTAFRRLRRSPRFTLAFVLPLAIGLGAGATFYGIIDRMLYEPPPHVVRADEIVRVAVQRDSTVDPFVVGDISTAWVDYEAIVRHNNTLSSVAAFANSYPSLGRGAGARRVAVMLATASFFPTLGVQPQVGRFYNEAEDQVTSTSVPCVLGDRFWRSQYGGANMLGQVLEVGTLRCTIVGIAPRGFNGVGIRAVDLYLPLRASAEATHGDDALWRTDGSHWMFILARQKESASVAAINADATRAYRTFTSRRRDPQMIQRMKAEPLMAASSSAASTRVKLAKWLTYGSTALVLLVAANLVNLLIARNISRARETAVRIALGGGRQRLLREQLAEGFLLSTLAAAVTIATMYWSTPFVRGLLFPGVEWGRGALSIRMVIIAFGACMALCAAIAVGATAHAVRVDPARLLNGASRATSSRRTRRFQLGMVAVQAGVSMALLVASTSFVKSFRNAVNVPLGFEPKGLLFAEIDASDVDSTYEGRYAIYRTIQERVRALPFVDDAAIGYTSPWRNSRTEQLRIPGRDSLPPVDLYKDPIFDAVSHEYFDVMRIRLLAGRGITAGDRQGTMPVVVVNQKMAQHYWGDARRAVGQCVQIGETPGTANVCRQVVGVVADHQFTDQIGAAAVPAYFLPREQAGEYRSEMRVFVRTRGDDAETLAALREIVQTTAPNIPAATVQRVQDQIDPLTSSWRLGAFAFTALGGIAVAVAMLGLFSVLAWFVAEREREFAIRMALGARASQILGIVARQGTLVTLGGTALGVVAIWYAARWIEPLLFRTTVFDARVFAGVGVSLVLVALCASLLTARRAAQADPASVMRDA